MQRDLIIERKEFLLSQIQTTIGKMMTAISENSSLGDCPENGWVYKKGGNLGSGFHHAVQIVRALLKYNTPMTQHDLANCLGVKCNNHGVEVSTNALNQQVCSFPLAIKLFLTHKIMFTNIS